MLLQFWGEYPAADQFFGECADNRNRYENIFMRRELMSTHEHVCNGDHSGHICLLASQDKFEDIKKLTKNPQFLCFNCGRVADSEKNLCNPMPLE